MLKPKIKKLNNGFKIITDYISYVDTITICFYIKAGSEYETIENNGIGDFLAYILNAKKGELSLEIQCSKEGISIFSKGLKEDLDKNIVGLFSFLKNIKISEEEFIGFKNEHIKNLEGMINNPNPQWLAQVFYESIAYQGHSFARSIIGTEESLKNISKEDVGHYINKILIPSNIVIAISGNFNEESLLEELQKQNQDWRQLESGNFQGLSFESGEEESFESKVFNSQKDLLINEKIEHNVAFIGYGLENVSNNENYYKWQILKNTIQTRLDNVLYNLAHEVNGHRVAYGNTSYLKNIGYLYTGVVCDKDKVQEVQKVIKEEYLKASKDLQEEELQRSKNILKYSVSRQIENSYDRCSVLLVMVDNIEFTYLFTKLEDFKLEEAKAMLEQLAIQEPCIAVVSNEEIEI